MNYQKLLIICILISTAVSFNMGCGGGSKGTSTPGDKVEVLSVTPAPGIIDVSQSITVVFGGSVYGDVIIGGTGTMKDEWDKIITWSTTNTDNDTIILRPASTWSSGSHTLEISGSSIVTAEFTYTVDSDIPVIDPVTPADGMTINRTRSISLQFSKDIDPSTCIYGGSMSLVMLKPVTYDSINFILTIDPDPALSVDGWGLNAQSLSVTCSDYVGHESNTEILNYTVSSVSPILSVDPAANQAINTSQQIEIIFSEAVSTCSIGGTIGSSYSAIDLADGKSITINPVTVWNEGNDRTLTVTCNDINNQPFVDEVLYFSPDTNFAFIEYTRIITSTLPYTERSFTADEIYNNLFYLQPTHEIIIYFSEIIENKASLSMTGSLSQFAQGVWTDTTVSTLTIKPNTGDNKWPQGENFSLNISCSDDGTTLDQSMNATIDGSKPYGGLYSDIFGTSDVSRAKINSATPIYVEFNETMMLPGNLADAVTLVWNSGDFNTNKGNYTITIEPNTYGDPDSRLKIVPNTGWGTGDHITGAQGNIEISLTDFAGNYPSNANGPSSEKIIIYVHVDSTPPELTGIMFDHPSGTTFDVTNSLTIGGNHDIILTFNEPVRVGTSTVPSQVWSGFDISMSQVELIDDLASDFFFGQSWDEPVNGASDQIVISPTSNWTGSSAKSIRLNVLDMARNESLIDQTTNNPGSLNLNISLDSSPPVFQATNVHPNTNFDLGVATNIRSEMSLSQVITVTFNENIRTVSGSASIIFGTFSMDTVDGSSNTLVFRPTTSWTKQTLNQSIDLSGITVFDTIGNSTPLTGVYEYKTLPLPVATVTPAVGATIDDQQPIYIKFRRSMAQGTLSLTNGGLYSTAPIQTWQQSVFVDDTLVLTPDSTWSSGTNNIGITVNELGGPQVQLQFTFTVESIGTYFTIDRPSGDLIDDQESIQLTFTGTVSGTPSLSGSIETTIDGILGSNILTLTPNSGVWTAGDSKTLKISGLTDGADPLPDIDLTYIVYNDNVHADNDGTYGGDDNDPGTEAYPKATIQDAVDFAAGIYGTGSTVKVADGSYDGNPVFKLTNTVSVWGGYVGKTGPTASDWSDGTRTITTLNGTGTNGAVEGDTNITDTTVIDGFTINADNTNNSKGVYLHGSGLPSVIEVSPTIQNCNIYGMDANALDNRTTYAVYGINAAPTIQDCFINNDTNRGMDDNSTSYGIYLENPPDGSNVIIHGNYIVGGREDPSANNEGSGSNDDDGTNYYGLAIKLDLDRTYNIRISNNKIDGAESSTGEGNNSYGLYLYLDTLATSAIINARIYNNLIHGGDTYDGGGSTSTAIHLNYLSPEIQNNSLYSYGNDGTYGIYLAGGSKPWIRNNIISIYENGYDNGYCIYEEGADDDPSTVEYNAFYVYNDVERKYYYYDYDNDNDGDAGTIAFIQSSNFSSQTVTTGDGTQTLDSLTLNNNNAYPDFVTRVFSSADFLKIKATTNASIRTGGLNGANEGWSWDGSWEDYFETARTPVDTTATGWSMGAHEVDP